MSKRKYTMSAKAKAQRRSAAWKHGQRAATALTQSVPPCKKSLCPLEGDEKGNCSIKRAMEAKDKSMEVCPLPLAVNADTRRAYLTALQNGDFGGLQEMVATLFAGMFGFAMEEFGRLSDEGGSITFDIFGPDGEKAQGTKVNPRYEPFLKLLEVLGITASQQAITPKSQGEKKRDDGIGNAMDFYRRRAALAGGGLKVIDR